MKGIVIAIASFAAILGCAQTDIQPLTQSSFNIETTATPACGPSGARRVANQAAAIEVIRRGGDRFVFVGAQAGSRVTGVAYNAYTGLNVRRANDQTLVVQMVSEGQPGYADALSARGLLGPDWQSLVSEGVPNTCTE